MSRSIQLHFKKIRGKLQKQIVTKLPISPEMSLAIFLYKLTRGNYECTIGEMPGVVQSTVCRVVTELSQPAVIDMELE